MINIYEEARKRMKPEEIDHWQTDLYLKVTPVSQQLVKIYSYRNNTTIFESNFGNDLWYDIPFAFPFKIFEKVNGVVKTWEFSHYNENGEHVYYNGICIDKYREEIVVTDFSKYEF